MSYIKRFGDFCCGFAIFSEFMYLFTQYMSMDFKEAEVLLERLKYFFSNEPRRDYRYHLTLLVLLIVSFAATMIFHKLPYLTLAVSTLPAIQIVALFDENKLYERPMLYIVLIAIHMGACLFECIRRDREDKRRRAAIATDLVGGVIVGFCVYVLRAAETISEVDFTRITVIERELYLAVVYSEAELSWFTYIAVAVAVAVILRLILRDLYYLDAALSLVLFFGAIYLWYSGRLPVFGSVLAVLTFIYAASRISVMLFCKPKCIDERS